MRTVLNSLAPALALVVVCANAGAAVAHDEPVPTTTGRALPAGARADLAHLRTSLVQYRDPAAAVAAGWIPTDACVALPDGSAGMGYHYVNPRFLSGAPDAAHPPILVYVPTAAGGRTLGAAEWFQADADQDLATSDDRPELSGIPFDGPMPGHEPGMPIHYDLHAWLFAPNPAGLTAPFNPKVHC